MDLFMTFLYLGRKGYKDLLKKRKELFGELRSKLGECAQKHGQRVLETPHNPISMGITIDGYEAKEATELGSMLYTRFVSGTR